MTLFVSQHYTSIDDLVARTSSRLSQSAKAKLDISPSCTIRRLNQLGLVQLTTSRLALQSIKDDLDSPNTRNDDLLASNEDYRWLIQEMMGFCGNTIDSPTLSTDIRLFTLLNGLLNECLQVNDTLTQSRMLRDCRDWFAKQRCSGRHSASRLAIDRFEDYSRHDLAVSGLFNIRSIETPNLAKRHAARRSISYQDLLQELNDRSYSPPNIPLDTSPSPHRPINTESVPDLDTIWRQGRQREAMTEYVSRQIKGQVQVWGERRARYREQLARTQTELVSMGHQGTDQADDDRGHYRSQAWSQTPDNSWAIDPVRHGIPAGPMAITDGQTPSDIVSHQTDAIATLPSIRFPAQPLLSQNTRMTPWQLLDLRQGSTRTLFNPQTALTVDMGYEDRFGPNTSTDLPSDHVNQLEDMMEVERCRVRLVKAGIDIGRGVLERALVQPGADLTTADRKTLFQQSGEGLLLNPYGEAAVLAKTSSKGKGKKKSGSKTKKKSKK